MSEETTIRLNEKRYSLRTAAKVFGISETAVAYRAKKMGIDMSRGLTARDIKEIQNYPQRKNRRGTERELLTELEAMK